ncbi:MAG: hypothetical protein NVSMB23_04120 [Myxococcales bacterium]
MPLGFTLFVAACALIAAYGARALARSLGISPPGALLAGLAYAWSGPFVSLIESGQCVAPAFLPWLCAAGAALGARASGPGRELRRPAAWASLCAALVFFSGTPEIGACAFFLSAVLALATAGPGFRLRAAAWSAASAALGACLALVQLLPAAEFLRRSSRAGGFQFEQATTYSLHPLRLPGLLFPFFAGELDAPGTPQWLLDPGTQAPYVQEIYAGALVLSLAVLGVSRKGGRDRVQVVFAAACCALLVLALGSHTPLYRVVSTLFPPLHLVRFPEKLVVPFALALAVLAGAGWDRVRAWSEGLSPAGRRAWSVVEGRSLAAALLLFAGALLSFALSLNADAFALQLGPARAACLRATALPSLGTELAALGLVLAVSVFRSRGILGARAWTFALATLLVLDLAVPAARLDYTVPEAEITGESPLAALVRDDAGAPVSPFRVSVQATGTDAPTLDGLFDRSWPRPRKLFHLRRMALYDAGAALAGVKQDRGYSGFTPGPLRELYMRNGKEALDLLAVKYGVEFGRPVPFYARLGFKARSSLLSGYVRVFDNPGARERLRLVTAVLAPSSTPLPLPPCPGRDAVWLERADADALRTRLALPADCAGLAAPAGGGTVRLLRDLPEEVEGEVDTTSPALAVLADTWDPGWSVFVDGARSLSLAADGVLRAVFVPAGRHRILWIYRAPGLALGGTVSLLALCVWLALLLGGRRRTEHAASAA